MVANGIAADLVSRIDPARPLIQQGVDSVDYPGFIVAFEDAFGIAISDAKSAFTPQDLERFRELRRRAPMTMDRNEALKRLRE